MLNTILEVAKGTREKYKAATKMSRPEDWHEGGFYSRTYNGIGCALGCHMTPTQANTADGLSGFMSGSFAVEVILEHDLALLAGAINLESVSVEELSNLQKVHDYSQSLADFRESLDVFIANLEGEDASTQ